MTSEEKSLAKQERREKKALWRASINSRLVRLEDAIGLNRVKKLEDELLIQRQRALKAEEIAHEAQRGRSAAELRCSAYRANIEEKDAKYEECLAAKDAAINSIDAYRKQIEGLTGAGHYEPVDPRPAVPEFVPETYASVQSVIREGCELAGITEETIEEASPKPKPKPKPRSFDTFRG